MRPGNTVRWAYLMQLQQGRYLMARAGASSAARCRVTGTGWRRARRPPRTVCKMIGFQGFWRFKAIYFSIGAFFVNITGGKLAPLNSKEMTRFTFGRFSLVRSQTHVRNSHFLQNYQVVKSDTRYRRNLNLVSGSGIRYSKPVLIQSTHTNPIILHTVRR
eukprot:SAG31_NODE_45_length_31062_cov_17.179957_19_plen_160_part_00